MAGKSGNAWVADQYDTVSMSTSFKAQGALTAPNDVSHTLERRRRHKDERSDHGLAAMRTWQLFTH
jgi:hypothetical protein